MIKRYRNREEAGRLLASKLREYSDRSDVVVLALSQGGVPVACEIGKSINAPVDFYPVRKPGASEEPVREAIAPGGFRLLNADSILGMIPEIAVSAVTSQQRWEVERQERAYCGNLPPVSLPGRTVILVDEGLLNGATMSAAIAAVRRTRPARVVIAAPVASPQACDELSAEVSHMVCPLVIEPFENTSRWYTDFHPLSDDDVCALLKQAARREYAA